MQLPLQLCDAALSDIHLTLAGFLGAPIHRGFSALSGTGLLSPARRRLEIELLDHLIVAFDALPGVLTVVFANVHTDPVPSRALRRDGSRAGADEGIKNDFRFG